MRHALDQAAPLSGAMGAVVVKPQVEQVANFLGRKTRLHAASAQS
jgi:hypothetical protein